MNSLDQLFFEIVNGNLKSASTSRSVLKILLSLYRSAGPSPSNVITWNLKRFSLSYAALSLKVPELFEDEESSDGGSNSSRFGELIEILISRKPNVYVTFYEDLAENLSSDMELFDSIFGGIFDSIIERILRGKHEEQLVSMTTDLPNIILSILGPISRVPKVSEFLVQRSGYFSGEIESCTEVTRSSLIGAILTGMSVDAPDNFDAMRALLPKDYGPPLPQHLLMAAYQSLRENLELLISSLQENFLVPLIKSSPEHRNVILKHFAALAKVNGNRAKLQAEAGTINSDGFVMGMFWILLKLCDPFTLAGESVKASKVPLIDVNFILNSKMCYI